MKRTHPIFNLSKESSGARPQGSSGSQAQKPKNSKKAGGFSSSPTSLPKPAKFPSVPAASNGSEGMCVPTVLPAAKNPPKRRCSPILDESKDVVNKESKSNYPWAYPSTSKGAIKKPHISLELKVFKGPPQASPSKQQARQMRIPKTSPKRSNSNRNCCTRLRKRATGVRKGVRRIWDKMMAKKRVWDAWNPDKTHPIAACIDESKLAGLKETIKPNKGICYRIMWLLLFCIAFAIGTMMSINAYKFQKENPVLFAFDTKEISVEKLPPPGFTTCPHAAFKASSVTQATEEYSAIEQEASIRSEKSNRDLNYYSKLLYFMSHICEAKTIHSSRHGQGYHNEFTKHEYARNLMATGTEVKDSVTDDELTNKIIPFMKKASPNCDEMVKYCSWNMQSGGSCKFTPTFETTGGCCSFNRLPDSALYKGKRSLKTLWANEGTGRDSKKDQTKKWNNWSLHKHLRHMNDPDSGEILEGPLRQASGGWPWGVSFVVTMDENGSDCPQFDGSGTRVAISVPGVDVDVERESVLVPPNHEVFIRIFPEVTIADEDLKTISYEKRGCYMEKERNLTYYNFYNQENCHRECVADFVLKTCGCVLLSFPNSADQKVCNVLEFECVRKAEGEMVREMKLSKICPHCLPTCSHMTLRLETTMTPFSSTHVSDMARSVTGNSSLVHSFYGPKSIIAKVRKLRHSKYELYSEVGSIYETTNDMSVLGYIRIFIGITITVTAYITFRCVRSFCRKRNIRIFDLQRRLILHPIRRRQRARVPVADVEARGGDRDVATASAENSTSTTADVFVVDYSNGVLQL